MRFSTGTLTVGIFAILFGLIGAYALRAALTREAPPAREAPRTVNVPLANNHLPAGRRITLGDMGLMPMTQEMMVQRKYPLESLMINSDQVVGRILREDLKPGDPFLTTNMYPEGTGPNLAEKLKPGMRAFTLPIDDLSSVGASTVVGSIVDVLFRSKAEPANREQRRPAIPEATVVLVQGAEVIAVGRNEAAGRDPRADVDIRRSNKSENANAFRSVTLSVTPEQATMLRAAMGHGEIYLALSPPVTTPAVGSQSSNGKQGPMTLDKLLGVKAPIEPFTMEVYRGRGRQSVTFEESQVVDEKYWEDRVKDARETKTDLAVKNPNGQQNNAAANGSNFPIDWNRWRPSYNGGGMGGYGGYGGGSNAYGYGTNYSFGDYGTFGGYSGF